MIKRQREERPVSVTGGGVGFTGLLQIAFIVLKLCKIINWSWLWVLSPIWISAVLVVLFLAIFFIIMVVVNS